eukprot:2766178-Prymnesium_polylepis.1
MYASHKDWLLLVTAKMSECAFKLRSSPAYPFGLTSYHHDALSDDRSVPMCNYTLLPRDARYCHIIVDATGYLVVVGRSGTSQQGPCSGSKKELVLDRRNIIRQTDTWSPCPHRLANVAAVRIDT